MTPISRSERWSTFSPACHFIYAGWFTSTQIQGSKEKGIENLKQVALHGQYYGPFAKILLAVVYLREKKPQEARIYLSEVARDYPENPLIRKELDKLNRKLSGKK